MHHLIVRWRTCSDGGARRSWTARRSARRFQDSIGGTTGMCPRSPDAWKTFTTQRRWLPPCLQWDL